MKRAIAIALALSAMTPASAAAASLHVSPSSVPAGDVVRVYNERGACLAGAVLTRDLRPGVVRLPTGGSFGHATLRVNRSAFVDAVPRTVRRGHAVRLFGSVRAGCPRGATVTLFSGALNPRHQFAGVPAVIARVGAGGAFSTTTTIPGNRAAGTYSVGGRCGGGSFGHTALRVTR